MEFPGGLSMGQGKTHIASRIGKCQALRSIEVEFCERRKTMCRRGEYRIIHQLKILREQCWLTSVRKWSPLLRHELASGVWEPIIYYNTTISNYTNAPHYKFLNFLASTEQIQMKIYHTSPYYSKPVNAMCKHCCKTTHRPKPYVRPYHKTHVSTKW